MFDKTLSERTKAFIFSTISTTFVLVIAMLMTFAQAGFDPSNFNVMNFVMYTIYNFVGRAVFIKVAKQVGFEQEEIVQLKKTIGKDKGELYGSPGRIQLAEANIRKRNDLKKLQKYLDKIDSKPPKKEKKRKEYLEHRNNVILLMKAIREENIEATEQYSMIVNINTLKVRFVSTVWEISTNLFSLKQQQCFVN